MAQFIIARQGVPCCRIDAPEAFSVAARALEQYLCAITGANTFSSDTPRRIVLHQADHGANGFAYRVEDSDLILEAQNATAAQYGVYDLLERLAGCRFYTSTVEKVPFDPDLTLTVEEYDFSPVLQFRELYYRDYGDPVFAAKRKMHPFEQHAGWGFWCHSFSQLMPSEEYYPQHPEYFALIDGRRDPKGQLCLSNPHVLEIVIERLRGFMQAQPDKLYWSVSQDDHDRYCRCDKCRALDDADGTPMGSILNFVNQVAARFPDKIISTLAYWYSRKAPRLTHPAPNVHIMLCNIEALRGEPLTEDPRNAGTVAELKEWAAICGQVFLWDYNIQFANLVSPFPNLNTLAPNMRFFVENSVRSLFSQCNREIGGEMAELRGYMLSKLMWDPYCDAQAVMEDFIDGYFGAAGPHVLRYIDRMHQASHESGEPLGIFHGPFDAAHSYLTSALCAEYDADFDAAEAAVADDFSLLQRVRVARMPLIYAKLVLRYTSRQERLAEAARFARSARAQGLKMVEEWKITVDQFLTDTLAELGRDRLAFGRERLDAMRILGITGQGTARELIRNSHSLLKEIGAYVAVAQVASAEGVYSIDWGDTLFVGLPLVDNSYLPGPDYETVSLPAGEYITVHCEGTDLVDAYSALNRYLRDLHLTPHTAIIDRQSQTDMHTLLVGI